MFEMKEKATNNPVRVYEIDMVNMMAVIFDEATYRQNQGGWRKVKLNKLIPVDVPNDPSEMISKNQQAKAKKRMKLVDATWETSDGDQWDHTLIGDAIKHEIELMNKEKETVNEEM